MKRSLIISLVIVSILLVFSLQNQNNTAAVKFLFWGWEEISQTFVVIISLLLGFILGISLSIPYIIRKNKKIDDLNRFIDDFREKERKLVEEEEEKNFNKE